MLAALIALLGMSHAEYCAQLFGEESLVVEVGAYSCRVATAGSIECDSEEDAGFEASLGLEPDECVPRASGVEFEEDVVLLYTHGTVEAARSSITRFDTSGVRMWTLAIPGFNIGEPLQEGRALYVTAHGFLGRLDLLKGEWMWYHEGLYLSMGFGNSFAKPRRVGTFIEFVEDPQPGLSERLNTLHVNPDTGELRGNW